MAAAELRGPDRRPQAETVQTFRRRMPALPLRRLDAAEAAGFVNRGATLALTAALRACAVPDKH